MGTYIVSMINALIKMIGAALTWLISFLPDSPFNVVFDSVTVSPFIQNLNWFIPITESIAIFQAWVLSIATYYIYVLIMRWIKLLGSS